MGGWVYWNRAFVSCLIVGVLWGTPLRGQTDIDSLKAAHEMLREAVATENVDLMAERIHPRALGFFRGSQFPIQLTLRDNVREFAPSLLTNLSHFLMTPYTQLYRVVGDTGIVCTTSSGLPPLGAKKKEGLGFTRGTYVYSKVNGDWLLLSWHTSDTPLE